MSTQPKPFSQYTLSNAVSPKMIVLPINEPARRDGKWAKTAVRDLLQSVFPDVPVTHRQHKELVGQFAGWTGVARHYAELGDMLKAGVLVDDPREGVDAFYWYLNFLQSPELHLPEAIAGFDLHGTPLVAPRETSVMKLPAGPAAYSYSQRDSSFNGHRCITRNVEYYISLNDHGSTLVFHYQWADPANDRIQPQVADKFANMIEILPFS